MKIQGKTLKGELFDVDDVDPEILVSELKKKIQGLRPEFPAEGQKLIFAGRILADEKPVKEYGIEEGNFLVVMMGSKPKGPPLSAPSAAATVVPPDSAAPAPAAAAPAAATAAAASGPGEDAPPLNMDTAASQLLSDGAAMEASITQLMDMGFERAQVEQCLRAAFNNPDRAVEYLMGGLPPELLQQAAAEGEETGAAPGATGNAPAAAAAPGVPAVGPGGGDNNGISAGGALDALRSNPQFEQIRAMVQQNPQMLMQVLGALQQSNPELFALISQNQTEFVRMLQEPGAAGAPGGAGGGPHVVQLTPEEGAAVERLQAMGFEQGPALEAYLACDKNEEVAANYLLENPTGPEEEAGAGGGGPGGGGSGFEGAAFPAMGGAPPGRGGNNETSTGGGALEVLRNNPQFEQIRAMVQQNPQMLPEVLGALQQSSPELFALINQNREEFVQMLQGPAAPGGAGGNPMMMNGGAPVVQLTQEEREAVERLQALGFPRVEALQAYIACDKNEEMAANYLFESQEDDGVRVQA